jgi:type I site-specific restriction endonuclease
MMMRPVLDSVPERTDPCPPESGSIADLFLTASRELASSDARLYRSLDKHLKRTRELLSSEAEQLDTTQILKDSHRDLIGASSYERQTRSSLQDLCKVHGITGYSRMTKKAMIESLISKGIDKPRIPLEALSKAELIAALRDVLRH